MDTTTESKLEAMRAGRAVQLQIAELEQLEDAGIEIRTVHNLDAVGTRSAPYVGWVGSGKPPAFRYDAEPDARGARRAWGRAGELA